MAADRGVPGGRIEALAGSGRAIDVWGVNWYPQFSHYRIDGAPGVTRPRKVPGTRHDLAELLRDVHRRTGLPVMVTETSVHGGVHLRLPWVAELERLASELESEGLPLVGITWFPAFSLLSWDSRRWPRPPAVSSPTSACGIFDPSRTGPCAAIERRSPARSRQWSAPGTVSPS